MGRKHEPTFRLVLTDSENATKSGRFKEILGSYDPRRLGASLKKERIEYWISQGAGLTDTVHNLLIKHRVIRGKKIDVSAKSKKAPQEVPAPTEGASPSPEQVETGASASLPVEPESPIEGVKSEPVLETPTEKTVEVAEDATIGEATETEKVA